MYVCMYVCVCVCVRVCMRVCVYIYIYTYTCTMEVWGLGFLMWLNDIMLLGVVVAAFNRIAHDKAQDVAAPQYFRV